MNKSDIIIYQSPEGELSVDVKLDQDTVWLTQKQMSQLFDKDVRTINEHIKNIYIEQELTSISTIRNFRIVQQEGSRKVAREIDHYNLDLVISVGYRVNSKRGTQFRIWANKILKEYLVQGYSINEKKLKNQTEKDLTVIKEVHLKPFRIKL